MTFDDALRMFRDRTLSPDWQSFDFRVPIDRLRSQFSIASRVMEREVPTLAVVSSEIVPGAAGPIKARLYVPRGAGIPPGPGVVFFHGGGFVLGDLESHDVLCRRLAEASRCRIIAIDYRRAPEHGFPAAHDDALAVWTHIHANAGQYGMDAARLAIAGDSAGGNLAIYVSQTMTRERGPKPMFQLLLYPLVQFADIRSRKLKAKESGFFVSQNIFEFFRDSYVKDAGQRMDPRVSPLFADEAAFKGLPPAHVVLAGWDPLHDEGGVFAEKMQSFGTRVTLREHGDMVHGFMNLTALSDTARQAIRDAGIVTGKALGAL
jgi:acetyl esterase